MASSWSWSILLFYLWTFRYASGQDGCSSGDCFPRNTEITGFYNATTNSTCGTPREEYCIAQSGSDCSKVCDASNPNTSHPVSHVNDAFDLKTFWKSRNVDQPVFIDFNFGAVYIFMQAMLLFEYEVPAAMYLSKSKDFGFSYDVIGFYSSDCQAYYNMTETQYNRRNASLTECFKINPLSSDQRVNHMPMQDTVIAAKIRVDHNVQLKFLMTNFRVVLDKYVTPPGYDPPTSSDTLKKSFYFSIQNIDILAACFCNGQADTCDTKDPSVCVCEKNTAGNNCEKCLPLFNNKPYAPQRACEDCGCNNHSASCEYHSSKGYGVCLNCTDNTMGDKCEQCKPEFYRNPDTPLNHTNTCLDCACTLTGVRNMPNNTECNAVTGECDCKPNVQGRACDTCKDTMWNISNTSPQGCQECGCHGAGTVNASDVCRKLDGQCPCKQAVTGRTCDTCKDGFYSLNAGNTAGCSACNCDPAGSINVTCSDGGACHCRPHFSGLKCDVIERGFYKASVEELVFEAEKGVIAPAQDQIIRHSMSPDSSGNNRLFVAVELVEGNNVTEPSRVALTVSLPKTSFYDVALRYQTKTNWQLIKMTLSLRSLFSSFSCDGGVTMVTNNTPTTLLSNLPSGAEAAVFDRGACLREGVYAVEVVLSPGSTGANKATAKLALDSVVIFPSITRYAEYTRASPALQQNMSYYHGLVPDYRNWTGHKEIGCQVLAGFYGDLYQKGQACECNATGAVTPSVCDQCGGQCSCRPHVIGRKCDECRPDYYDFTSGLGCKACACNMTGSKRSSCHPDTGKCECHPSITERQCSRCLDHYFNFTSGVGCQPCGCNELYSRDLQCDNDTGVCSCKDGVGGAKCTECSDAFYNLTTEGCTGCQCDLNGSLNPVCNKLNGNCTCRSNAIGRLCDSCPDGSYGLRAGHPDGCLRCHCSGFSTNCSMASGYTRGQLISDFLLTADPTDLDGWTGRYPNGQLASNLRSSISNLPGGLRFHIEASSARDFYFSAPTKYLTRGRYAYTHAMTFSLQQDNTTIPSSSTRGDVIIKGRYFNSELVTSLPTPPGLTFTTYKVVFLESNWRIGNTSGRVATDKELVRVLSSLEYLWIRGRWTNLTDPSLKTRLMDITMTIANKSSIGDTVFNVETCQCPIQYVGQFCERCAPGYTRATPNGGAYTPCVPCSCNNHTDTCDPESGVCIDCQHNTTGDHCEKCAVGLYGDATNGTSSDCRECPCPGGPFSANSFARSCVLGSDGLPTCTNCSESHAGRQCERCQDGYYGTPTDPVNGQCRKCNCNGNVDPGVTGNCNTTTGECLKCLYNTSGFNCQWCVSGFHGNATAKTCQACNCTDLGSKHGVCNNVTGQCDCHPLVTGLSCERCVKDAFNYTSGKGCTACGCHPQGSNDTQCDAVFGNCTCNTNVKGDKCDQCMPNFYDVGKSCIACNCSENYTQPNTTCDVVTGQCKCNISSGGGYYGGRTCDSCAWQAVADPTDPKVCYPCTEDCYRNWYGHIQVEKVRVVALDRNVSFMLDSFGGLSVEKINSTLQELNKDLEEAEVVFKGAQYNTKQYEDLIDGIRSTITDLQTRLNNSRRALAETAQYLDTSVYAFNGSVNVTLQVFADWISLNAMATKLKTQALAHNSSGHASYASILNSYNTIQLANATAATAAQQIADAMTRLDEVARQRGEVESRLGSEFQARLHQNRELLSQIQQLSNEIVALAAAAKAAGDNASTTVTSAEITVRLANQTAYQKRTQAQQALQNAETARTEATEAKTAAEHAQRAAGEFNTNATAVLSEATTALHNVTQGIKTIESVTNMTRDSETLAQSTREKQMPVTLETIQNLANQIKNTPVNNTLINQTYESAAEGLKTAREIEAVSQEAINAAEKTLSEVQSIENNTNSARTARDQTENLQKETDQKVAEIKNITDSVQAKFSSALTMGEETLNLINNTIATVDQSLQCYNESKSRALTAAKTAEHAYNISLEAKRVNESIARDLPTAAAKIDTLYATAHANYTAITSAHNDSVQLLKDVREAEVLLEDYTQQREEMTILQGEVTTLESELDTLTKQLDEDLQKYESCGST